MLVPALAPLVLRSGRVGYVWLDDRLASEAVATDTGT